MSGTSYKAYFHPCPNCGFQPPPEEVTYDTLAIQCPYCRNAFCYVKRPERIFGSEKLLDYLKAEFAKRWPDATVILKNYPTYLNTVLNMEQVWGVNELEVEAACLWLGFREGFKLGHDFAHKEPIEL